MSRSFFNKLANYKRELFGYNVFISFLISTCVNIFFSISFSADLASVYISYSLEATVTYD